MDKKDEYKDLIYKEIIIMKEAMISLGEHRIIDCNLLSEEYLYLLGYLVAFDMYIPDEEVLERKGFKLGVADGKGDKEMLEIGNKNI